MENKLALVTRLTVERGHVVRTCKIMDLSGVGTKHLNTAGLKYFQTILHLSQAYYPEMLGRVYVINCPWAFNILWKIVKPWLNEQTLSKVVICGNDYQEVLLRNIAEESLPTYLGGKCECPGGCVELKNPEDLFTKQTVKAGAFHEVELKIEDRDTLISWEFWTRKNDIRFSAIFTDKDNKTTTVFEAKRVDAASHRIEGGFEAQETGVLRLNWDNTYSSWTGKEVVYRIDLSKNVKAEFN